MNSAKSYIQVFLFSITLSLSLGVGEKADAGMSFLSFCQNILHTSSEPLQVSSPEAAAEPEAKQTDQWAELHRTYNEFVGLSELVKQELTAYQEGNSNLGFQLRLVPANLHLKPSLEDKSSAEPSPVVESENPWEIVKVIRGRRGSVDFDPSLWPIQLQAMDLEGGHFDSGMALGVYGTEKRLFTLLRTDRIVLNEQNAYRNWAHEAALVNLLKSWANEFKTNGKIEYVPRAFHSTVGSGPGFTAIRELAISVKGFGSREEMIRAHLFLLEKIALLVKDSQKAGELAYRDSYIPAFNIKPSF